MSDLDVAMMEHMAYIVLSEHRPASFRDFLQFEVDGKEYRMATGTVRNKISRLRKAGEIEFEYNSGAAFYTLTGHRLGKPITPNHTGVCYNNNEPIVRIIQNLPMDKKALHNIRLRFEVRGIWTALSTHHPELPINYNSKDILIPTYYIDNLLVRVTVHRTDTVSVSVACSLAPIVADINNVILFSTALTRVEERLNELLKNANTPVGCPNNDESDQVATTIGKNRNNQELKLQVPGHNHWIVTMWHFGADSLVEYAGDMFQVTWEVGRQALVRAYTKVMKDKKVRIRLERQEYPNKTLGQAIEEKLNSGEGCRS